MEPRAPSSSPALPAARIYKKTTLTLQQRLLLITQMQDKISVDVLAERYGVTERAVRKIFTRREHVWRAASAGVPHVFRTARPPRFPLVDARLFEWFTQAQGAGRTQLPISLLTLKTRARQYASQLYPGRPFTASNGFVQGFLRRHQVKSIRLHGTGGSTPPVDAEQKMVELRAKMAGMDPDMVFNMDDAALFYQLAPTRSYVLEQEARTMRGTPLQRAKARLTTVVCVNATGTFKFISVIGSASQPECFRGQAEFLPLKYYSQKNGWMDEHVYRLWLADFCEALVAFKSSKAVLLLDNASGHIMNLETDQLSVEGLPANTTAWFQACDQGIIHCTKCIYKREMTSKMLVCADEHAAESPMATEARLARQIGARRGTLGVDDGKSPHVLDAMRLLKSNFEQITPSCIMRCWLKARCLPTCVETKVRERLEAETELNDAPPDDDAHANVIVDMLRSPQSSGGDGAAIGSQLLSGNDPDALPNFRGWLGSEDDRGALFEIVNQMTESISTWS